MTDATEKPSYLVKTDDIGFLVPIIWATLALIVGVLFYEVSVAIIVSVLSLIGTWINYKLASFFFSFQQHSGILNNSTYDRVLKYIWLASVFGFMISITYAVITQASQIAYGNVVFSIVFYGFALASTRKWGCYFVPRNSSQKHV